MNRIELVTVTALIIVAALFAPIAYILVTGDYAGAVYTYGAQEDSKLVDIVFTVREYFTA